MVTSHDKAIAHNQLLVQSKQRSARSGMCPSCLYSRAAGLFVGKLALAQAGDVSTSMLSKGHWFHSCQQHGSLCKNVTVGQ